MSFEIEKQLCTEAGMSAACLFIAFLIFLTLSIFLSYLGNVFFLGLKTNVNPINVNDHENDAVCIITLS